MKLLQKVILQNQDQNSCRSKRVLRYENVDIKTQRDHHQQDQLVMSANHKHSVEQDWFPHCNVT